MALMFLYLRLTLPPNAAIWVNRVADGPEGVCKITDTVLYGDLLDMSFKSDAIFSCLGKNLRDLYLDDALASNPFPSSGPIPIIGRRRSAIMSSRRTFFI